MWPFAVFSMIGQSATVNEHLYVIERHMLLLGLIIIRSQSGKFLVMISGTVVSLLRGQFSKTALHPTSIHFQLPLSVNKQSSVHTQAHNIKYGLLNVF